MPRSSILGDNLRREERPSRPTPSSAVVIEVNSNDAPTRATTLCARAASLATVVLLIGCGVGVGIWASYAGE